MQAHGKGKSVLLPLNASFRDVLEISLGLEHAQVNTDPVLTPGPTIFHTLTTPISKPVLGPTPHGAITIISTTPLVVVRTGNYSRDEHDVVLPVVIRLDLYTGGT